MLPGGGHTQCMSASGVIVIVFFSPTFLSAFNMPGGTCTGTREYAGSPSRSPGHIKWMLLKEPRGTFKGDLGYANDMHAGKLPYMAWWLHLRLS